MTENPIVHGLLYSYIGKGCRCDDCRGAMREYSAMYRSTPEGREKSVTSSRRANFLRQKCVAFVKEDRPDLYRQFESEWEAMRGTTHQSAS